MDKDVVDFFETELSKKEKKLSKKIEKDRLKEEKELRRKEKILEHKENKEFNSYLMKVKEIEKKKKNIDYFNILIIILSITLMVISFDYLFFNIFSNFKDMINSILLVSSIIFYLLSIILRHNLVKPCQLLSIILMILFMSYKLFMA